MNLSMGERTADTVRIYFEKANNPQIKKTLPQKAKTVEEALEDYEKTCLPGATSFGQTVCMDGTYVGDIWCYCMDLNEEPNCMLSYCVFEPRLWSKGIATKAVELFTQTIREKFDIRSIGAFTYADHEASIKVLLKNGFTVREEFTEDGVLSVYLQRDF